MVKFIQAVAVCMLLAAVAPSAFAQDQGVETAPLVQQGEEYEILGVAVEGVENDATAQVVLQTSGLQVGERVTIPGDPAFADAIRAVYRLRMFSDVKVSIDRTLGDGVYLVIQVREEPRLADYRFEGDVKRGHRDDLRDEIPLLKGTTVRPGDVERSVQAIKDFYADKGYLMAEVDVDRQVDDATNTVTLVFNVDRGRKVEVGEIIVHGNEHVSDSRIRRVMETNVDRWWRFWSSSRFKEKEYEEDLGRIVDYYNTRGFIDAQVLDDTVYVRANEGKPEVVIELTVHEGDQYFVRDVAWEGNTVYSDATLTETLGFDRGDVFDREKLEQNLFMNRNNTDVGSLYMNQGYMRFNARPDVRVVDEDSVDLIIDVFEGDVYNFGAIEITGNMKTKDHVIRRELITVPGQTFGRDAIQESLRRLQQLNYFNPEALQTGISTDINEATKTVDLTYAVEEVGSDQLELSGTWGRFGLILMLRFGFNNFSAQNLFNGDAWDPLPSGDGQQLSLGIQTNGRYYQNYSVSFTEPWFRGRPTPIGFSVAHSRLDGAAFSRLSNVGKFITTSGRFFYNQRLRWPDSFFTTSSSIGYQHFNNEYYRTLPQGVSQEITFEQSLSRNSLDNPLFPTRGSSMLLSVKVAPPIGDFIQYHKWRFRTNWNVPLANKLSIGFTTDYGFIGSVTGEEVQFERFTVGGSPFDTQGFYNFGQDIIYMRGYPRDAIGPRLEGEAAGGRILNKYTSELRWLAVQTPQLRAAPYIFFDAANTWNGFGSFNPAELYRSAGFGVRLFLPIVGMLELAYGYNFDEFVPASTTNAETGLPGWRLQFSLGQGFGQ